MMPDCLHKGTTTLCQSSKAHCPACSGSHELSLKLSSTAMHKLGAHELDDSGLSLLSLALKNSMGQGTTPGRMALSSSFRRARTCSVAVRSQALKRLHLCRKRQASTLRLVPSRYPQSPSSLLLYHTYRLHFTLPAAFQHSASRSRCSVCLSH